MLDIARKLHFFYAQTKTEIDKMKTQLAVIIAFITIFGASCAKPPVANFSAVEINLGIVAPGEVLTDSIWIKNTGAGILKAQGRSGCDCIDIARNFADSLITADSSYLSFVYYAPESAKVDTSTIFIASNDPKVTAQKIVVIATITAPKLKTTDSTITLVPFSTGDDQLKSLSDASVKHFFEKVQPKTKYIPANPNPVVRGLTTDKQYGKTPLETIVRKYALIEGIRWVVLTQLSHGDAGKIKVTIAMVDGFSEFPISAEFTLPAQAVQTAVLDTVDAILKDLPRRYSEALRSGMAKKWAMQKMQIIEKPLPNIEFKDVRTSTILKREDAAGKVLLLHFFGIDCEHCEEEIAWMRSLNEKHMGNLVVWGVSVDLGEEAKVKEFVEKKNLPYPIVLPTAESHRKLTRIYGGATPQTILVDGNGVVREFFVGFNKPLTTMLEKKLEELGVKQ